MQADWLELKGGLVEQTARRNRALNGLHVMRAVLLAILVLLSTYARADFTGRVVRISDGDTLTVMVEKRQVRVRLDSIDAPERRQAFGKRSQNSLAQLCASRQAHVAERGKDRYGRIIGVVTCAAIDANAEQVRRGMAWVFVRYAAPNSPLYALERAARSERVGLWADQRPIPPWEWRAKVRTNEVGKAW
jgi:endonuclease YncB( thermonuclease family)